MSSVMAYFLFWMIFIYKQDCAVIRLDHRNRNTLEYVIQKYMNPLRRLSADLPNHAIEMEIEILGSVPREVTNDPRRFIRLINPRHPKPIPRTQDAEVVPDPPAAADLATPVAGFPETEQGAPAIPPTVPAPAAPPAERVPDTGTDEKIPVFMEDLKKALYELEKKLITAPENSAAGPTTPSTGASVAPQGLNTPAAPPPVLSPPVRTIDEIVQLLKKAVHVEHRMPKVGDENLEWVQLKIPKSVQL